ncbi:5'-methylthioadenosine/S-adenosylhomocysteine nucleosidase, partial [Staphylococcus aureus]|uniref:5'-methylthioadenosine/S-adenosylhomocysteine nucleosidase n=1 Tax=Staphylococcus aureus TaxID=1280 RepID=UPI00210E3521
ILKVREVVISQSGMVKFNAAISTTLISNKFKPVVIINTCSAGALDESLNVCDVLRSDDEKYHDADATAVGYEYGQIPQMPVAFQPIKPLIEKVSQVVQQQQLTAKVCLIVIGDSFIGSVEQRQKIK